MFTAQRFVCGLEMSKVISEEGLLRHLPCGMRTRPVVSSWRTVVLVVFNGVYSLCPNSALFSGKNIRIHWHLNIDDVLKPSILQYYIDRDSQIKSFPSIWVINTKMNHWNILKSSKSSWAQWKVVKNEWFLALFGRRNVFHNFRGTILKDRSVDDGTICFQQVLQGIPTAEMKLGAFSCIMGRWIAYSKWRSKELRIERGNHGFVNLGSP